MLRGLAAIPEVERVEVFAHSRGTDIVTSAIRELLIESRAAGMDVREELKIEHLVLLAPDLDLEVAALVGLVAGGLVGVVGVVAWWRRRI